MVDVRAQTDRRNGVTLVTATVTAENGPTRVRLEPTVEGAVWPPRRQGEPEAGWENDTFEGTVPANGRLAVGFATPAPPAEPPVRVVDVRPAGTDGGDFDSPSAVLRGLGDPSPPSLGVPADDTPTEDRPPVLNIDESAENDTEPVTHASAEGALEKTAAEVDEPNEGPEEEPEFPPAIEEWLSTVAARVDRGEALAPDADPEAAADAIEACGGLDPALALEGALADDVKRLRAIEKRVGTLADRAEDATVARRALERLR